MPPRGLQARGPEEIHGDSSVLLRASRLPPGREVFNANAPPPEADPSLAVQSCQPTLGFSRIGGQRFLWGEVQFDLRLSPPPVIRSGSPSGASVRTATCPAAGPPPRRC